MERGELARISLRWVGFIRRRLDSAASIELRLKNIEAL
jgi:hypothetical protein